MKTLRTASLLLLAATLALAAIGAAIVVLNLNLADLFDAAVGTVAVAGVLSLLVWDTVPLDPLRRTSTTPQRSAPCRPVAFRALTGVQALACTR